MALSFKGIMTAVDITIKSGHVPCIIGLQGIGKTDLVHQYCNDNGYFFREITCSFLQEGDLALPYKDDNGGVSYAISHIIMELNDMGRNYERAILFLDEFNRASERVQSELMNLVLQRRIAGYKLNDNVSIILAMNPNSSMLGYESSDYSVSFSDMAIWGRVVSLDMVPVLDDWVSYGRLVVNDVQVVHPAVIEFLVSHANLFVTKETGKEINNTPRGWSRCSDIIKTWETYGYSGYNILKNLLCGTLSDSTGELFVEFYRNYKKSHKSDYSVISRTILSAKSSDDWDSQVFDMSDMELDSLFKYMLDIVSSSSKPGYIEGFCLFISSCTNELAYSWVTSLQSKYPSVYKEMMGLSSFSSFVMGLFKDMSASTSAFRSKGN